MQESSDGEKHLILFGLWQRIEWLFLSESY
jgi:hypothetical protein